MRSILLLAALSASLLGCKDDVPQHLPVRTNPVVVSHSESEVFAGLRFEAQRRGLRWKIFCIPADNTTPEHYQAYAEDKKSPEDALYAEDGALDSWAEADGTAVGAAYKLYLALAINRPPNINPIHKRKPGKCNYNSVYDSEHDGKLPCPKEQP